MTMWKILVVLFGVFIVTIIVIGLVYPNGSQESEGDIVVDEVIVGYDNKERMR